VEKDEKAVVDQECKVMGANFKRKVFHIIIYSEIYKKLKYFYKRDK
jgi:hypothetical protein